MKSRIHLALGAVCVASICAISIGASEQAQAGAVADQAQVDAVVSTVLGREIMESELQLTDEVHESGTPQSELQAMRLQVLAWKIVDPLRERFVAAQDAAPTGEELEEATIYFRTKVTHWPAGMTQREVQERLVTLEAEAAAARADKQERPALQEEIDELRGFLEQSIRVEGLGARMFAEDWKFQRALHRKYGGRARMGQAHPEAIDAMRAWLKEAFDRGDFTFANEADEAAFWAKYPAPGEAIHSEIENAAQTFETLTAYLEASAPAG